MLILFICSTDLTDYIDEDLIGFAEVIEGRVEVLFESDYLISLNENFQITSDILLDFKLLQEFLTSLYESRWSNKMKDKVIWVKANILARGLLNKLKIDWIKPGKFVENHLNVDWT